MKLNKTLMIAALIAGSVFTVGIAAHAQNATNTPPASTRPPGGPGARNLMNFDYIATQLGLSEDQKTKAKPIFEEMRQKMTDLRKDTATQAADKPAKAKEIRDDATAKLKDILTPEQLEKWQKLGPANRRGAAKPKSPQ